MARVEIDETVLRTAGGGALVPAAGASVRVYLRDTSTNATVYVAETGGSTRAQPLTTDANGRIEGWVAEGSYDLAVSIGGTLMYTQPWEAWRSANVRAFGLTGDVAQDATTQLDWSSTDIAGQALHFPAGTYTFNAGVWQPRPGTRVTCDPLAVFKPQGSDNAIKFYSPTPRTPTTTYPLTANTAVGDVTVTVSTANAANFAVGDMVVVRDQTPPLPAESSHRQTTKVVAVNTSTGVVTVAHPLSFAYLTANSAFIAKVTPAEAVRWSGGFFDMTGVVPTGSADCDAIFADWALDCLVENVRGTNWTHKIVDFHGALDSTISRIWGWNPAAVLPGQGYVARMHYSQNCSIENIHGRNVRHVVDIAGGSDCHIEGVYGAGRTSSNQCAAFLHGIESRRCTIRTVHAENMETAFGAGNGTFGPDYDFDAAGIVAAGCDNGVAIAVGCTGWRVQWKARDSIIRGGYIDNSDGTIDADIDGILTNPSNFGALTTSGTANVRGRVKVRNALYQSIGLYGSGTNDLEIDVDHPAAATGHAVVGSSLSASSVIRLRGAVAVANVASLDAVSMAMPTGSTLDVDVTLTGTALRGVHLTGASVTQTVRGRVRGTYTEQIRLDAGEVDIPDFDFSSAGTNCINASTSAAKVTLGPGVRWRGTQTRLVNSAGATVVGGKAVQNGLAASQGYGDADATISVHANPENIICTTALTANRTITLSTTNAQPGARFRVVRTAASTGAFTLSVGGLKSLSTSQWCEVLVNASGTWTLVANGSL